MITSNEIYNDLISLKKKIDFIKNPKHSNEQQANFWKMIGERLNKNIIEYVERDKKLFGW